MPSPRNRPHLLVPGSPSIEPYRPHGRKITIPEAPPPASRPAHGAALKAAIETAAGEAKSRRLTAGIEVHGAEPGLYVEFSSQPGVPLNLPTLEDARQGIELVAVTHAESPELGPIVQRATVFVPDGKVKHFVKRFEQYAKTAPKEKGERRHEKMIDAVSSLRLATLHSLWTDAPGAYPDSGAKIWWEVWLRRHDGKELERLMEFAGFQGLSVGARRLQFDDRIIVTVKATATDLSASVDVLNDLAEVRRAKETASVFVAMAPGEQVEWLEDLLKRSSGPEVEAPAVCVLDTGVTRGHPLLKGALAEGDCIAVDPEWGPHDDGGGPSMMGHGTEMAGLALYGNLTEVLQSEGPVLLRHRLESVKILPPGAVNPSELYGAITAEATGRIEVQNPNRRRCFALAVTAEDERDRGEPTSWSAAIDAISVGRSFDSSSQGLVYLDEQGDNPRRLFVVSAGNVNGSLLEVGHLERSDTEPIHDPAHAWNALTVGGYTDLATIAGDGWDGWRPVASAGDLSPWSTTSVVFAKQWPLKPDVVFEAGNVVANDAEEVDFPCEDLSLLSTHYQPVEKAFALSWATSAATAQAARMAAMISAEYPRLGPEAIRGLIVHSAEWTRAMHAHLCGASGKRNREQLVRRYGFGVPRLDRALRSASDSLTLIAQGTIRPFAVKKLREMHLYELPWPTDVLQSLGEQSVRLRVTLSYFIEPNPGRRGWTKRHRYASHGLRFDVKGPTESIEEFRKRLNQQALDQNETKPVGGSSAADWYLGEQARNRGSIHSDFLQSFAADLAERGVVGVYPVSGWWKDQPKRDRSEKGAHYALIVSIETDAEDVDIWTPVATELGIEVES